MEHIKVLIVDDVEDNRLILRMICRKIEGLQIYEAEDGIDALDTCDAIRPRIVLMDIMMPRMNGLDASRIIKERYPETVIMAVTAVIDPYMEERMASIGVSAYIRKPLDKELIRLKIQSYAASLSIGGREKPLVSKKTAKNPFSKQVRHFKTLFEIDSPEAIMDFGIWLLGRFECARTCCTKIDAVLDLLYELIYQEIRSGAVIVLTVEESFDELFIVLPVPEVIVPDPKTERLLEDLSGLCMLQGRFAAFRLPLHGAERPSVPGPEVAGAPVAEPAPPVPAAVVEGDALPPSQSRKIADKERRVLRESFIHKITADEYIASLDPDAYWEVHDLRDAQEEWDNSLQSLAKQASKEKVYRFSDDVLGLYVNAISSLYEFSGLAYAIVSLRALIREHADMIVENEAVRFNVLQFLRYFKNDLSSWLEHVFELRDAQDIHYLDASFFSSCMQIESIITGAEIDTGEEGDIEFF